MADVARSAVTTHNEWTTGRNHRFKVKDCTVVLSSQGGNTNKIVAAAFGMSKIISVTDARDPSTGDIYIASASATGTHVVIGTWSGDAQASVTPTDVSDASIRMVVTGKP